MATRRTRYVVAIENSKAWLYDSGHAKKADAELRAAHLRLAFGAGGAGIKKIVKVLPHVQWLTLSAIQNIVGSK